MKRTIKKKRYSKKQYSRKKNTIKKNTRKKRYSRKNKKTLSRKKRRYSKKRLVGGAEGEEEVEQITFEINVYEDESDKETGKDPQEITFPYPKSEVNDKMNVNELRIKLEKKMEEAGHKYFWVFKTREGEIIEQEQESKILVKDIIKENYDKSENEEDISDEQENYRKAETEYLVRNELEELKKKREELEKLEVELSENYQKAMGDIDSQKTKYKEEDDERKKYYEDLFNNYSKGLKSLCGKNESDDLTPEDTEQCLNKLKNDIDWAKENKATKDYYDQTIEEKNRKTEKEYDEKLIEQANIYEVKLEESKKAYEKADKDRKKYYENLFIDYSKGLKSLCGKDESEDLPPEVAKDCLSKLKNDIEKAKEISPDKNEFLTKLNDLLINMNDNLNNNLNK